MYLRTARPPSSLYRSDSAWAMAQRPLLITFSAYSSTLFSGNLKRFWTIDVNSLILRPFSPEKYYIDLKLNNRKPIWTQKKIKRLFIHLRLQIKIKINVVFYCFNLIKEKNTMWNPSFKKKTTKWVILMIPAMSQSVGTKQFIIFWEENSIPNFLK